jgi:type II secretory pathway component PulM
MDALHAAWQTRTPRERAALAFGSAAVVFLVFYGFVWEPLRAEQKRLRESLPHLRAQSAQFAADAAEAGRLREMRRTASASESPRAAIEAAAVEAGVRPRIKSVAEVAGGRLQVAVDALPYEALIRWIGALASSAGIGVESLQLRPGATSGTVVVDTLVLKGRGVEP